MTKPYFEVKDVEKKYIDAANVPMLVRMLADMYTERWHFLSLCVFFSASFFLFSLTLNNVYESESTLMPNQALEGRFPGALTGALGSIGSLAGIDLAAGVGTSPTDKALAILVSRDFLYDFIETEHLKQIMFQDKWDESSGEWKKVSYWQSLLQNIGLQRKRLTAEPSMELAHLAFIDEHFTYSQNPKTNLVTLKIYAPDGELAQKLNSRIVSKLNDAVRTRDIEQAESSLRYLKNRIKNELSVEIQQALYSLIESESKKLMMANISAEYAFSIIDTPSSSDIPKGPRRLLYAIGGGVIGLLFAFFLLVFRRYLQAVKSENLI
ncbi:MAG: hypothetical protein D6160_10245 [Ketobacter sp.]|nr:MAG: hypothetical protein D6160_10245 [Ketobacter sp.]